MFNLQANKRRYLIVVSIVVLVLIIFLLSRAPIKIGETEGISNIDEGLSVAKSKGLVSEINKKIGYDGKEILLKSAYSDGLRCFILAAIPDADIAEMLGTLVLRPSKGKEVLFNSIKLVGENTYELMSENLECAAGGNLSLIMQENSTTRRILWQINFTI